jgi:hypothetical protein
MKQWTTVFITALLIFNNTAFAKEAVSLHRQWPISAAWRSKVHNGIERAGKATVKSSSHLSSTLIIIGIISYIEAIHQKGEINKLSGLNESALNKELMGTVATELVNSFDLYMAILGGATIGKTLSKPIQVMQGLLKNSTSRTLTAKLLASGLQSYLTFVGWEIGGQLWQEAIYLLDNANEIEAAQNLKVFKLLSGNGTANEKIIFTKLLDNMFLILNLGDPQFAQSLIYNTWRLRIATGDFMTIVTAMFTAGTVAGSLAPGGGTVIGALFGLTGGVIGGTLAVYTPEPIKTSITSGFQSARMWFSQGGIQQTAYDIDRDLDYLNYSQSKELKDNVLFALKLHLTERSKSRNDYMTATLERYYTERVKIQGLEQRLTLMQQSSTVKTEEKLYHSLKAELNLSLKKAATSEVQIKKYYDQEITYFLKLRDKVAAHAFLSPLIMNELELLYGIHQILTQMINGFKLSSDSRERIDAESFLNYFYLRGYSENLFTAE